MRVLALLVALSLARITAAAPAGYFDLGEDIQLESGDSWKRDGSRYHLYGVQACLRGTKYTDIAGNRSDCGEASLVAFAAFIFDTNPVCTPIVTIDRIEHVMCYATIGSDRLDLGYLLIASGFAFAALRSDGLPYSAGYAVAEQLARDKKKGLWQFKDVQHPAILLGRAAGAFPGR